MRSFSFVVAFLFALFATTYAWPEAKFLEVRKGHKNGTEAKNGTSKANPEVKACRKMARLEHITKLAANQTKLDALVSKGKLNQTEVDKIKAKAANATTELQTMQGNATLVSDCAVVDAHERLVGECKAMKKLSKLASLANNQTAMDAFMAKKKLNDTQMAKLQQRIANATTKLQKMQSNTTLTDACKQQQKGKTGDQTSSSTGAAASGQSTKSAASAIALQGMPYVFVPLLAGIFAFFL